MHKILNKDTFSMKVMLPLLHVSDSIAHRYLNELVKQGKGRKFGPPSHISRYKIP